MTAPTSLDDARAFGAAANAGERANLVEAQRRARHAVPVAPVQAELFGTAGELQPELFEIDR